MMAALPVGTGRVVAFPAHCPPGEHGRMPASALVQAVRAIEGGKATPPVEGQEERDRLAEACDQIAASLRYGSIDDAWTALGWLDAKLTRLWVETRGRG